MKDTERKIFISKEMLRDYATMDKCWNDITLIPFSKVSIDDIECSEYYRMDLEDMREVLTKCRSKRISAVSFFLEWWEPMLVHLYDYLELSEMFGPNPGNIKNMRLIDLPTTDEGLLKWIIRHIFDKYEQFTLSMINAELNEYLSVGQILQQIEWHYEDVDNEEVLPGRYIDLIKHDYIMELDNDLILKDADPVTRAVFKEFTDQLAESGDFEALRIKGYASYGGSSLYPCDYQIAADCMEKLWKEGSFGYAANTLGYIYYYGRLGKPDYEKAFFYFPVGSTYGITESSYKLADMFMKGLYVKRNIGLAASMIERLYGEDFGIPVLDGLERRSDRQDAASEARLDRQLGYRKSSRNVPDTGVQSQFSHDQILVQRRHGGLLRGGYYAESYRKIVSAAALVHVGRRQVDHYLLPGDPESHRLKGCHGPEQTLFDSDIRQAYEMDADSGRDVDFYRYRDSVNPDTFRTVYVYYHFSFNIV